MEHSKTPWRIEPATKKDNWRIIAANNQVVSTFSGNMDMDNARRIVACVNACAGLDTAFLENITMLCGEYVAPKHGDSVATLGRLVKAAYQRGVRDERDRSADALVAEGVAEYERGLKDGAKLERNACLAEIETGIWMDKTTEEVLGEIAEVIRARSKEST